MVGLTDSSGTVVNTYAYDPMGNVTTTTGTTANPFTYGGMMYDSSNGFYYSGSGYYDPATGQDSGCKDKGHADTWASEDACGEDEAPYDDIWTKTQPLHTVLFNGKLAKSPGGWLKIVIWYPNPKSGSQIVAQLAFNVPAKYQSGRSPDFWVVAGATQCHSVGAPSWTNPSTSDPCTITTSLAVDGVLHISATASATRIALTGAAGGEVQGESIIGNFWANFPV